MDKTAAAPTPALPHIPLMSEADANAAIAFSTVNLMHTSQRVSQLSMLVQQNAETARQATLAADELGKQLKTVTDERDALKARLEALEPTPADPAPGPTETASPAEPLPTMDA